jgi:hypothetical protein
MVLILLLMLTKQVNYWLGKPITYVSLASKANASTQQVIFGITFQSIGSSC